MMNIVPPLNIQKKDIRLKKMTSKYSLLPHDEMSLTLVSVTTPQKESWPEEPGWGKKVFWKAQRTHLLIPT